MSVWSVADTRRGTRCGGGGGGVGGVGGGDMDGVDGVFNSSPENCRGWSLFGSIWNASYGLLGRVVWVRPAQGRPRWKLYILTEFWSAMTIKLCACYPSGGTCLSRWLVKRMSKGQWWRSRLVTSLTVTVTVTVTVRVWCTLLDVRPREWYVVRASTQH